MPVTLADAQLNVQDDLQMGVIDEFRKSSWLLDNLTFDDVVSATGGGATLTYAYTRLITQPTASFRGINEEYTASEVRKDRFFADLKVFGGTYKIDRVLANMGGIVSEVQLQSSQKVKAAQTLFNDTVINGDSAVDTNAFDGLDKALTGSTTEMTTAIDLSTSDAVTQNYRQMTDVMDEFVALLDGKPTGLLMNSKLYAKMRAVARRAGAYTESKDDFGRNITSYDNIVMVDMGEKAGTSAPVIDIDPLTGETSMYAVRLGMDGFHGISMAGVAPVQTWLPDFSTSGAVKTGEVEMVAGVALKATKAAGVLRGIKVSPVGP